MLLGLLRVEVKLGEALEDSKGAQQAKNDTVV